MDLVLEKCSDYELKMNDIIYDFHLYPFSCPFVPVLPYI